MSEELESLRMRGEARDPLKQSISLRERIARLRRGGKAHLNILQRIKIRLIFESVSKL